MKPSIRSEGKAKDLFMKFFSVILIASMALLLLNVMTQNKDGRKQIVDLDGGMEDTKETSGDDLKEEERLSQILSQIKGVGQAEVFITYEDTGEVTSVFSNASDKELIKVKGVIVAAQGAENPVIKNGIINAVASVFHLSTGNVMVFEKE